MKRLVVKIAASSAAFVRIAVQAGDTRTVVVFSIGVPQCPAHFRSTAKQHWLPAVKLIMVHGKLEVLPKFNVNRLDDIATLYTPGVAYSVQEIIANPEALHELSIKDNTIGVVTDGTAVLGLGRAGPYAAVPVMEGKAAMFKLLAGIDAIPLCVSVQESLELVDILAALEPTFGGYNIEDVAAPSCFELMRELEARLTVPAIHDDQYGTATVIAAAIMNACKVTNRELGELRVVINGAGAAGTATFDLLSGMGVGDIIVNDLAGILCTGQVKSPAHHVSIAAHSNCSSSSINTPSVNG